MVSQADTVSYLLSHGLLTTDAVVDGELKVRDASSRNRNFRVECSRGPSYLMKQGLGPEGVATVAREAGVYQFLSSNAGFRSCLPQFYAYDPDQQVLVLELIRSGTDMRGYHQQVRKFGLGVAGGLGRALGALHLATSLTHPVSPCPGQAPLVLALHKPHSGIFRDLSSTSIELIKIIQHAPSLCRGLDLLRATWTPSALIHQDVKWDNIIVTKRAGRRGSDSVIIVDWEAAVEGDPCWDVGSAFSAFLSHWLFSIPVTGQSPPEQFPRLASSPLEGMQPAIYRCWQAYVAEAGLERPNRRALLLRSVQFAAARLVQTAFEVSQVAMELNGTIVLHLQLAQNMLDRTAEAAVHLLGIPVYEPAA